MKPRTFVIGENQCLLFSEGKCHFGYKNAKKGKRFAKATAVGKFRTVNDLLLKSLAKKVNR